MGFGSKPPSPPPIPAAPPAAMPATQANPDVQKAGTNQRSAAAGAAASGTDATGPGGLEAPKTAQTSLLGG